jgi:hypothetical protein
MSSRKTAPLDMTEGALALAQTDTVELAHRIAYAEFLLLLTAS